MESGINSMKKKSTIITIAEELGVSPSTVSRAFNPASKISNEARQRILQCAKRQNYVPNRTASRLSMREINIGVVCGACDISQADALTQRWQAEKSVGVSLQAYLGLSDEEYHAFSQPNGTERLAELLNAQRRQLGCRIYQLEFTDTEKTKPFA